MSLARSFTAALAVTLTTLVPAEAAAQPSYEVVRSFTLPPSRPERAPIEMAPDVFVQETRAGGAHNMGAIVRLDRQPDGQFGTTVLHSLDETSTGYATTVMGGLDGNLYGITRRGGATDQGTAFRLTLDGQYTTLASFTGDHAFPDGLVLRAADGTFYGHYLARTGLFRMTTAGAVTFVEGSTGLDAPRLVQQTGGAIYGVDSSQRFFRLTATGFVVLRDFTPAGLYPGEIAAGRDGLFYLTAAMAVPAGAPSKTLVLRVSSTGAYSTVRTFTGVDLGALIEASDGRLYGTTANPAEVYLLTKAGIFTALHRFTGWDGNAPWALMQASDGHLYGVTADGGTSNRGTVFEISSAGFASRSHFSDRTPTLPAGSLVRGPDGALYGTSCLGGDFNAGTVFRMTEAGALTVLHSFNYWDGICPSTGLTVGTDGLFYGTARFTLFGQGSIFRISTSGTFTVLRQLAAGDGKAPLGLVLASDGNFYGVTSAADSTTSGAVFRLTHGGTFTVLHAFPRQSSGLGVANTALAQGSDGALYGQARVLTSPGSNASPGVYRQALDGTYTEMQPPIVASARLLTLAGGFFGLSGGNAFRMTTTGDITAVYDAPGGWLLGDPMLAQDGQVYATTVNGGATGHGQVFRTTVDGSFENLHEFSGADGESSLSGVVELAPGVFYGMTARGGPGGGGVIFRLSVQ